MKRKLKIGYILFPEALFNQGVVKSGSIIMNDQIISRLRAEGHTVIEFAPENKERLELRKLTGIGNALMFQGLISKVPEMNECDVVITTNYFGLIMPEIKKPIISIFHHSAKSLIEQLERERSDKEYIKLKRWKNRAKKFGLVYPTQEQFHDNVVTVLEEYQILNSSAIIAVSKYLKNELIEKYGADPKKIHVAYNSYPTEWDTLISKKDFTAKELSLTTVSRLPGSAGGFYMKGADRIFEIMKRVKGFNKTLVASTDSPDYKKLIKQEIPGVSYIENASHNEVGRQLAASHISLHCPRIESFGLTLIESMLMGNVPITFPVGVAPEIIENGKNGFLINNANEGIKILHSLRNNLNRLSEISESARRTVMNKLSSENACRRYVEIIEQCIEDRRNNAQN